MTGPEPCKTEREISDQEQKMIINSRLLMNPQVAFEKFWASYPRKHAKTTARKTWGKLKITRQLYTEIMIGLGNWKMSSEWQKSEGQFIPLPSSWLNQQRWNDEVEIKYPRGRVVPGAKYCHECKTTEGDVRYIKGKHWCRSCYGKQ